MQLTEIIIAIIFSGLLIVILLSVYFIYKNRRQRIRLIKRMPVDIQPEQFSHKENLTQTNINNSIEEITSGRYKVIKIHDEPYTGRDNERLSYSEQSVEKNNQNSLSAILIKRTSKRFSRLERIV